MKELLKKVNIALKEKGYKKRGQNFWKEKSGFYRLINFQKGGYGNYYFVNIALQPIGIPQLISDKLYIPEYPKEYECLIRQRIEEVVKDKEIVEAFSKDLVTPEDEDISDKLPQVLATEIEEWFDSMCHYEVLIDLDEEQVLHMVPVVPILVEKERMLIKCYSHYKLGHLNEAKNALKEFKNIQVENLSFESVYDYLENLIFEAEGK